MVGIRKTKSAITIVAITLSSQALSSPSKVEFFNTMYSQAYFLEQCISHEFIEKSETHNINIRLATKLGFGPEEFWQSGVRGSQGQIYDMLRGVWQTVKFNKANCRFVLGEQKKFNSTLSRY